MSTIWLFLLVVATASTVCNARSVDVWQSWKQQHNKQYADMGEEQTRRDIWQQRVDEMTTHNLRYEMGLETYKKGLNQFSDMTWDEFEKIYLRSLDLDQIELNNNNEIMGPVDVDELPASIDWRDKGYVTSVKNQGNCGSCWAFSAIGALEGQMANKTGRKAVSLSTQQLIDCEKDQSGCYGGWPANAMVYVHKNGIESAASYPYKAVQQKCAFDAKTAIFQNSGHLYVHNAGEARLAQMVARHGPISVAIEVTSDMNNYASGVYFTKQCHPGRVNHGVLVAGYGQENGVDYWLIKNEWATYWGDQGYIKMARNNGDMCNVALYPAAAIA